jgi:hypothetical protein
MRDIRLYYYQAGGLIKNQGGMKKHHLFNSLEECKEYIENPKSDALKYLYSYRQFVIIEYFDKYKSKIIEII